MLTNDVVGSILCSSNVAPWVLLPCHCMFKSIGPSCVQCLIMHYTCELPVIGVSDDSVIICLQISACHRLVKYPK